MLANRTEAMDNGRVDAGRVEPTGVGRLVLCGARGDRADARPGEELAGRITRLAAMAAVLHAARAAEQQRSNPAWESSPSTGDSR